jgi:drug/metabolite transporter (DMT)-like permease
MLTILGVLLLTPDSLLVRLISADVWTLLFWRGFLQGMAIIFFYLIMYRSEAIPRLRSAGMPAVIIGCSYALGNIMFVHSIRLTSAANTLLIISLCPFLAAILSRIFLHERTSLHTWFAAGTGMIGVAIIVSGGFSSGSWAGDLLALLSAICMAGSFVLIRRSHLSDMVPAVAVSGFIIALLVAPLAPELSVSSRDAGLLLLLGGIIIPVSFGLITLGPRFIPAPEVSLLMLIETVLGPTWVWLVLGEQPPATTFFGGTIVLVALIAHSLISLKKSL